MVEIHLNFVMLMIFATPLVYTVLYYYSPSDHQGNILVKLCKVCIALILIVLMLVSHSFSVQAQGVIDEQAKGVQLTDVPVRDDYIISLPKDWLVWKMEDYKTQQEGV